MESTQDSQDLEFSIENTDNIGLFIELIQNYEFLYNLGHKDYKNNLKKEQAWEEIALILHLSVEDCQKRWKWLRDRFTREKRDQFKSGMEAPESRWPYYDKMLFYGKYTKPRKTYTTTPRLSEPSTSKATTTPRLLGEPSTSKGPSWSSAITISPGISPRVGSPNNDQEMEQSTDQPAVVAPKVPKTTSKKRKTDTDEELLDVARQIATRMTPTDKNMNRTCVEYLYSCLENLTQEEAKIKRKELLAIILSE